MQQLGERGRSLGTELEDTRHRRGPMLGQHELFEGVIERGATGEAFVHHQAGNRVERGSAMLSPAITRDSCGEV
jgi:hypothetical protein